MAWLFGRKSASWTSLLPEKSGPNVTLINDVFIGRVKYVDYSSASERIPGEPSLWHRSHVNPSLTDMRASCALFIDMPGHRREQGAPTGHVLPVDLQRLVQRVVVSPLSPPWFESLVGSVCEHFGFKFPIGRSIVRGRRYTELSDRRYDAETIP